jgi:hypothetical protein
MVAIDRKFRKARIWSNCELKKFSHLFTGDIINVSAGENIDKQGLSYDSYFPKASKFIISNFSPGSFRGYQARKNELLIDLNRNIPKIYRNKFDVAIAHTVLEHIYDVRVAFRNICLLSRDIVIIIVPFAQIEHHSDSYQDYWRFSPAALRNLFAENQMEVIYEACNNEFNSSVYLFFIGSRHPEKWKGLIYPFLPIMNAGEWIGDHSKVEMNIKNIVKYIKMRFKNK